MWFGLAFQNFVHPEYIVELKYIESKLYKGDFGHVGRTTRWQSQICKYVINLKDFKFIKDKKEIGYKLYMLFFHKHATHLENHHQILYFEVLFCFII